MTLYMNAGQNSDRFLLLFKTLLLVKTPAAKKLKTADSSRQTEEMQ